MSDYEDLWATWAWWLRHQIDIDLISCGTGKVEQPHDQVAPEQLKDVSWETRFSRIFHAPLFRRSLTPTRFPRAQTKSIINAQQTKAL